MTRKVLLLVATMSGTAEMVADELADHLRSEGWDPQIRLMREVDASALAGFEYCLFCVATYGTGEMPDSGKALYGQLDTERPDLSHLRYGLVCLGDSNYQLTFCQAGKHLDQLLQSLGGVRAGDRLEHDRRAPGYPEEVAAEWLPGWLAALQFAVVDLEAK